MGGVAHQYNLNAGSSLIAGAMHDLNTAHSRSADIDAISEEDREDAPTSDSLDHEDVSSTVDCVAENFGHSVQLQGVGVDTNHSLSIDSDEIPRFSYGVLSVNDVLPIESARSRFLDLILENFTKDHLVPVPVSPESNCCSTNVKDKQKKRKAKDLQYEGDPNYVLPLAYVANLYETLISEINARLAIIDGIHEKTIHVALEAAGGLYRRLAKKYPKSGQYSFKRREMASAVEARNRFPHLVGGGEKRVRFVVVHGLEIVERPSFSYEDAEWFKRLTGRHEAFVTERDYKFFKPRHKFRRAPQPIVSNLSTLSALHGYPCEGMNISSHSPTHQSHQHQLHHCPTQPHLHYGPSHHSHFSHPSHAHQSSNLTDVSHTPSLSQHIISQGLHSSSMIQVGGRLVVLPSQYSSKFCDECGAPYPRETSKFCSECGTKRVFLGAS